VNFIKSLGDNFINNIMLGGKMKKFLLGFCVFLMGLTLSVKATVPTQIKETLATLSSDVEVLIAKDVASLDEREKLAQRIELDIALVLSKLNDLAEKNEIEMKDAVEIAHEYVQLLVILNDWKEGASK